MKTLNKLQVGDSLPPLEKPPISRHTLALYCGASFDHNPMHVDSDFAQAAGMPDVFAHGMLSMAYMGQLLTNWVPQQAIRNFKVRFGAIARLGDVITCQSTVVEKFEVQGEQLLRLTLTARNQNNDIKLQGEAVVAINHA
ncbi:MAG: acyl dehydratase [Bermanella sp.]|jgi:acyl dehydratase